MKSLPDRQAHGIPPLDEGGELIFVNLKGDVAFEEFDKDQIVVNMVRSARTYTLQARDGHQVNLNLQKSLDHLQELEIAVRDRYRIYEHRLMEMGTKLRQTNADIIDLQVELKKFTTASLFQLLKLWWKR